MMFHGYLGLLEGLYNIRSSGFFRGTPNNLLCTLLLEVAVAWNATEKLMFSLWFIPDGEIRWPHERPLMLVRKTRGTPARSQKSTVSHLVDHMNHIMFQCSAADILSSHLELWTLGITKLKKKTFVYLGWSRLLGKQSDFASKKGDPGFT